MKTIDIYDKGKWRLVEITEQFHAKLMSLKKGECLEGGHGGYEGSDRYICTREKNHTGAHVGHGLVDVCAAWPNAQTTNEKATQ